MRKHRPYLSLQLLFLACTAGLVVSFFFSPQYVDEFLSIPPVEPEITAQPHHNATTTLFFVGDIMLGRDVESKIEEHSFSTTIEPFKEVLAMVDYAFGNFEGTVPRVHTQTPLFSFQFSIREEYLVSLLAGGFDVLSLSNNHAYDFGSDAYAYTQQICTSLNAICAGVPNHVGSPKTQYFLKNNRKIAMIFAESVLSMLSTTTLQEAVDTVDTDVDFTILYIHWGVEYDRIHNNLQSKLAKLAIDNGVDLVMGHHPHVMQDIEVYKDRLIVYSLGNFIFDQYFSNDVMQGLTVLAELGATSTVYSFFPVSTKEEHTIPNPMNRADGKIIVSRLMGTTTREKYGLAYEDTVLTLPYKTSSAPVE